MAGRFTVEAVFKAVDRVTKPITRMQNRVGKFTRGMERGLRRANRAMAKMARGIGRGVKTAGVAIAAASIVAVAAIDRVAKAADDLGKQVRRLDFDIEEFQEWRFVAEQSGITAEGFGKSIEKFGKSIGEMKAGTGTLITILRKSNPELLKQLNATDSVTDAFDLYMKAIKGASDQTTKMALASAAFGRGTGLKFLNITELSTEALDALKKEMRENGVVTMEQAKIAEDYNDAINNLKWALQGLLQGAILPLLPAMKEAILSWREWIIANKEMLNIKIKTALLAVVEVVKKIGEGMAWVVRHKEGVLAVITTIIVLVSTLKALEVVMWAVNLAMIPVSGTVGLITVGIIAAVAAIALLILKWDELIAKVSESSVFAKLGSIGIKQPEQVITEDDLAGLRRKRITTQQERVASAISKNTPKPKQLAPAFKSTERSFADRSNEESAPAPQVIGPSERIARSISETINKESAEVTLKDETGRAEVTKGKMTGGLKLVPSGAFS